MPTVFVLKESRFARAGFGRSWAMRCRISRSRSVSDWKASEEIDDYQNKHSL